MDSSLFLSFVRQVVCLYVLGNRIPAFRSAGTLFLCNRFLFSVVKEDRLCKMPLRANPLDHAVEICPRARLWLGIPFWEATFGGSTRLQCTSVYKEGVALFLLAATLYGRVQAIAIITSTFGRSRNAPS